MPRRRPATRLIDDDTISDTATNWQLRNSWPGRLLWLCAIIRHVIPGGFVTDSRVIEVPVPITSLSLLARAKAQEPAAWNRIVDLYAPLVYSWCRSQGLQEADALDVGQEVFRAVYIHLTAYHRDRPGDSFRGWLKAITRNKVYDARRRDRNRERAGGGMINLLPQSQESPADPMDDDSERKAVLRRAIELVRADVAPQTWAAFWQVAIEGRPVQQVAADLGVSENVVYLAKSRTVRRLRDLYGELVEGLDDGTGTLG